MPHSIHRQLAERYAGDPGLVEVKVARYVVDAVSDGGEFIEIQTHGFHKLKSKLERLLEMGRVVLVFPTAYERQIVKLEDDSDEIRSQRRSPKRGSRADIIRELRGIAHIMEREDFSVHIVVTRERELRRDCVGGRHWRRKYEVIDRCLESVVRTERYETPQDYRRFIPNDLKRPFTNKSLARRLKTRPGNAQILTSLLRKMGVIESIGRTKEGLQYVTCDTTTPDEET
ncbi:MAG TPA: hypothetical protein QGH10_25405 [Armatimonadota bacterium]|nr:hypothetical protein [Armatimonadota bacterium]